MKILVTPTSFEKKENAQAREMLDQFADEVVYNDLKIPLKGEELLSRLEGSDGYIAGLDYITADVVRRMPDSLRVISRYGAGVDRVDLVACKARGITVTNTPGVNATAVCELVFGLMLSLARNIPQLHAAVQRGEWPRNDGMELAGRTLGIIGLGAIGKKLAARAKAFEMIVLAYDPFLDEQFVQAQGIKAADLTELLKTADIVSLHVPLTDETRHLIDRERIGIMKEGAIIINTARGGLIDEAACAGAITSGKLGGLGLDVFEQEPLVDSPLLGLPRVVFTPHTGAHTAEAVRDMGLMAVKNLISVLTGAHTPCVIK